MITVLDALQNGWHNLHNGLPELGEVEEIRATGKEMVRVLAEHTQQEDKDRQQLLIGVVSTLLAVLGGIAVIIGSQVHLFGQ